MTSEVKPPKPKDAGQAMGPQVYTGGLQACYRVMSWLAWGWLIVQLAKLGPRIYHYYLAPYYWHFSPHDSFPDPLFHALALGYRIPPWLMAVALLPMMVCCISLAWVWGRRSRCTARMPMAVEWAACALALCAGYWAVYAGAVFGSALEQYALLHQYNTQSLRSLPTILILGVISVSLTLVLSLGARHWLRLWWRWQNNQQIPHSPVQPSTTQPPCRQETP